MTQPASKLDIAELSPALIRGISCVVQRKGYSLDRLFKGLGFQADDLKQLPGIQVSYRQIKSVIKRFEALMGEQDLGLSVGRVHTPLALGLAGLGMLSCRTYGDAVKYVLERQRNAGAIMNFQFSIEKHQVVLTLTPKYEDSDHERFFVEAEFASVVSLGSIMLGSHFRPDALEVAYPQPPNYQEYQQTFHCPVKFMAQSHRMLLNSKWFETELRMYDPFLSPAIQEQLDSLIESDSARTDLVESVMTLLRSNLTSHTNAASVAAELNMSVRTLSRKLNDHGLSFQQLLDQVRFEKAQKLKSLYALSTAEIATAVGFADTSNFRRAYKRWTEHQRAGNRVS